MGATAAAAEWTRVANTSEIPEESALRVMAAGRGLCLARSRGRVYALADECSHGRVRLSEGDVEDGFVECYLHGSRFDLGTGQPLTLPATEPVATFPVRVDGDEIYVSVSVAPARR